MYTVLKHPDAPISTVMSRCDLRFPEFICMGYETIFEGTRCEAESFQERITAALVSAMDDDFWGLSLDIRGQ